jgi:hypothetical protein
VRLWALRPRLLCCSRESLPMYCEDLRVLTGIGSRTLSLLLVLIGRSGGRVRSCLCKVVSEFDVKHWMRIGAIDDAGLAEEIQLQ